MSIPDFELGETVDFKFTTLAFSTGIPTTLSGSPVVDVYEDNSTTQITSAETLTVDFDAVTGLNNLRIVATSGNGFEVGKSYAAVITTGTVDGVSVVGKVVAQFTIDRQSLRPITAGNTIDVTVAGKARIDFDGTVGTLSAAQIEANAIGASQLATDAVNEIRDAILSDSTSFAGANIDAAVSSRAAPGDAMDLVANAVDAAAIATDAIDADAIAADAIGSSELAATAVNEIRDAILSDSTPFNGASIAAILTDTDVTIPALITALNDLSSAQVNTEVLDVLNVDTFAEPTGVPAATVTLATKIGFLYMALRNRIDVDATDKTFFDDGGTSEWKKALSDNGTTYTESEASAP